MFLIVQMHVHGRTSFRSCACFVSRAPFDHGVFKHGALIAVHRECDATVRYFVRPRGGWYGWYRRRDCATTDAVMLSCAGPCAPGARSFAQTHMMSTSSVGFCFFVCQQMSGIRQLMRMASFSLRCDHVKQSLIPAHVSSSLFHSFLLGH